MPAGESDRTLQYISGAVEFFIEMVGMDMLVSMMVTWVQVIKVIII